MTKAMAREASLLDAWHAGRGEGGGVWVSAWGIRVAKSELLLGASDW